MLITITYKGNNTQELGFLLHKNPERAQQFELSYGKAYVFYPQVSDECTTAALLLDIDPIDLARGKVGSTEGGLFDYVNDRPYASTSFMSNAIVRIFGTAMSGRCDKRQELADTPLDLTCCIYALRDNGDEELVHELFGPLGYTVETKRGVLDDRFPEWGSSPYIDLTISGKVKLFELLNHIYVLIPVFDKQKHYFTDEDEIKKLLDHGKGWLEDHPYKEKIARRYFAVKKSYARKALDILLSYENEENTDDNIIDDTSIEPQTKEIHTPLNTQRMETVRDAVLESGAASVLDLGCGECRLTSLLLNEQQIRRITACDVSVNVLEKAAKRLHLDRMNEHRKNKLELIQGSLTYKDKRFEGFDCVCVVEVIEHIDPMRITSFERNVFEFAAPHTVILTTPNREYNVNYEHMEENDLRHGDHRFEWTHAEFREWTEHICSKFGYTCELRGIGDVDEKYGTPTQMAVFTKAGF
ncbi:MAG: 3' terminal RNA ribose 2'-O-methyltransferase Hen1 [Oscillospiraceae bacterium]|nr:3' terminal RNA ribose 2'-O-methyltransferase Hen1 [Oscillospiraceae bacterium]